MQHFGARPDHAARLRSLLPSWAGLTAALLALSLVAIAGAETLIVHTNRVHLARHAEQLAWQPPSLWLAPAPLGETRPPDSSERGLDPRRAGHRALEEHGPGKVHSSGVQLAVTLAELRASYPEASGVALFHTPTGSDPNTWSRVAQAGEFEFARQVQLQDHSVTSTTPTPHDEVVWTRSDAGERIAVAYPAGMLGVQAGALRSTIALTGLGILIAGLLASYSLASRVTGKLEHLRQAMDRAAAGDLDTRVEHHVRDGVVDEISTAFNHLAANVAADHHRAHKAAAQLEAAVEERTRELTEAYEELRSLDRAKERFLSSVSHEMRTPLTSIIAAVEILENFAEDDPAARMEFLGIVRREAHRLSRQIGDLLDLACIESHHLALSIQEVDFSQLIDDVVASCAPAAREAGIAIVVSKPRQPIRYRCDRQRMGQVVSNLIDNAVKFSPANGSVWITLKREGNRLAVRVRDEGEGVPPDQRSRLFDQFEQTNDFLTQKPRGMGIGLPISLRIVQVHGGTLDYEDGIRHGAQFVVLLPASEIVEGLASSDSVSTYCIGRDEEAGEDEEARSTA